MAYRADALCDDYFCRSAELPVQLRAQSRVGLVVKRGERVVKDQNFRLPRQRAGYRKPLLLAAGDVAPKLGDAVLLAVGQLVDKFARLCDVYRLRSVTVAAAFAEENVVADAAGEEHGFLRDIAETVVQRVKAVIADVHAVDQNLALSRIVKTRDEAYQR